MIDPRLGPLSLSHLKELRPPQTLDQSLKNISLILHRLKLLQQYNLLPKLSKGILYGLELRSFSQLRLQLYNNSKSLTLDEDKRNDIQSNFPNPSFLLFSSDLILESTIKDKFGNSITPKKVTYKTDSDYETLLQKYIDLKKIGARIYKVTTTS